MHVPGDQAEAVDDVHPGQVDLLSEIDPGPHAVHLERSGRLLELDHVAAADPEPAGHPQHCFDWMFRHEAAILPTAIPPPTTVITFAVDRRNGDENSSP